MLNSRRIWKNFEPNNLKIHVTGVPERKLDILMYLILSMLASESDDPKMCNVFTQIQYSIIIQAILACVDSVEDPKQQQQN